MRPFTYAIACMTLLFAACGGGKQAPATDTKAPEAAARIHEMEVKLFSSDSAFDHKRAQALLDVYLAYAKEFPLDTLTPEYLFRAAGGKNSIGDPRGGIELYDRIIANYPNWRKTPDACYLKALSLDKDLHQLGEAKTAYEAFIDRYPRHPYVKDAKKMEEYLGLTDEELIKRLEQQNDSLNATEAKAAK